MYDCHIHSSFSSDCKYSMENMVRGAIGKKAKLIVFTDHVDYEYGKNKIDITFIFSDYLKEVKRLKRKYKNEIEILIGIELGMQPHLIDISNKIVGSNEFDLVLMSIHTAKGLELTEEYFYKGKNPKLIYEEYYNELLNILNNFDNFDVVGHLDIIERYNKYTEKASLNEYKDILIEVLKKIIDMGKGIEVNTSGIRYGINSFHPNIEILKLYYQLGGEIITIGSDAHSPQYICDGYKDTVKLLKNIGFKYLNIFRNRKKHLIKL